MVLIADLLLGAGALGAAYFCFVLAGRLRSFTRLESGMGGAIALLSVQVDDMTRALDAAQASASGSVASLQALTERAEGAARRLELLMASLHDIDSPVAPGVPRGRTRVIRHAARSRQDEAA